MVDKEEYARFSVSLTPSVSDSQIEDGFNEYGVRTNRDEDGEIESIDVIFSAMEPGVRKGMEVTDEFLQNVSDRFSGNGPLMMDHSESQMANVGSVTDMKFSDTLKLITNIPNTGNSVKSDVIADFTHEPPAIEDGSMGFDPMSLEFAEPEDDDAIARFVDGMFREFSLTPFPAGYDENGGLSPTFSERLDEFTGSDDGENAVSRLTVEKSYLNF